VRRLRGRTGVLAALVAALAAVSFLVGAGTGHADEPPPAPGGAEAAPRPPAPLEVADPPRRAAPEPARPLPEIEWRRSTALGLPHDGALVNGVELPREGPSFFTWNPARKMSPNPPWRRYGTDWLVRTVLRVLDEYAAANPDAPRVAVGDLSRPHGGPFYPTHRSHQNGLDADVYFPRLDGQERPADGPEGIDRRLAQDLVDRFVAAGAQFVFVGPRTGLVGPPAVVQALEHHDRHLHVRLHNRR
jgi:hypothetical protein